MSPQTLESVGLMADKVRYDVCPTVIGDFTKCVEVLLLLSMQIYDGIFSTHITEVDHAELPCAQRL